MRWKRAAAQHGRHPSEAGEHVEDSDDAFRPAMMTGKSPILADSG
jgi:hypothetical protein